MHRPNRGPILGALAVIVLMSAPIYLNQFRSGVHTGNIWGIATGPDDTWVIPFSTLYWALAMSGLCVLGTSLARRNSQSARHIRDWLRPTTIGAATLVLMCLVTWMFGAILNTEYAVVHLAGVIWWTVCSLPVPLLVCAGILWSWAWNTKSKGLALVAALFAIPVIAGIPYTWVFTKDVYTVNLSAASPLFAVLVGVALPGLILLFGACAISFHDWKRDGSKDTRMSLINEPAVAQ